MLIPTNSGELNLSSVNNDKKQLKYYTPHILYKKKGNFFILCDLNGNIIGEVKFQVDEPSRTYFLYDLQLKTTISEELLSDFLAYSVAGAIDLQCVKFGIDNIPLKIKYITKVQEYFKRLYPNRLDFHYKINLKNWGYEISCNFINPKVTHYVQQSYLRNFSSNKEEWEELAQKDKARIFCFDIQTSKCTMAGSKFGQKIRNVAQSSYFYSLFFEDYIGNTLEKNITPLLTKIIKSESTRNLTPADKITLAEYILLQWNRTEAHRNQLRESSEKFAEILTKNILSHKMEKPLKNDFSIKVDENFLRMMHEEEILNFIDPSYPLDETGFNLVQHFLRLEWGLIRRIRQISSIPQIILLFSIIHILKKYIRLKENH